MTQTFSWEVMFKRDNGLTDNPKGTYIKVPPQHKKLHTHGNTMSKDILGLLLLKLQARISYAVT